MDVLRALPVGTNQYCFSLGNSTGQNADTTISGSTSIAANDLELIAGPVPTGNGLFFYGTDQVWLPFGDGARCVAGQTFRLRQRPTTGGLLAAEIDLTTPPHPAGQILPGSTWNFQAVYRDTAAGGTGFNTSSGLELTFQP